MFLQDLPTQTSRLALHGLEITKCWSLWKELSTFFGHCTSASEKFCFGHGFCGSHRKHLKCWRCFLSAMFIIHGKKSPKRWRIMSNEKPSCGVRSIIWNHIVRTVHSHTSKPEITTNAPSKAACECTGPMSSHSLTPVARRCNVDLTWRTTVKSIYKVCFEIKLVASQWFRTQKVWESWMMDQHPICLYTWRSWYKNWKHHQDPANPWPRCSLMYSQSASLV